MTEDDIFDQWKTDIEAFVIEDIKRSLERDCLQVGLIILSLLAIDCLGGYYAGKKSSRATFVAFIEAFFPPPYHSHADLIFEYLRNGLAHDYTIKRDDSHGEVFKLSGQPGEAHLTRVDPAQPYPIVVNRIAIAQDLLSAWKTFSREAESDPETFAKVIRRIRARGFLTVG